MKQFRSPHKLGRRFYNHPQESNAHFFSSSFAMLYKRRTLQQQTGQSCWIMDPNLSDPSSLDPIITWIGHASFLVQMGGYTILFDPVFGEISPLYRRILPAALTVDQLPRVDFVIISHNHRDHMDATSLLALKRRFPELVVVVPYGNKHWFDRHGFQTTHERMWWESLTCGEHQDLRPRLTVTCLPAAHWSQRGLFDKNRTLWASWLLECRGRTVYFAGDTCYESHFREIANVYPSLHVALLPIGPAEPRQVLQKAHIGPREAGKAFLELGARHMIPMHWGAFPFGVEQFDLPIVDIQQWWAENQEALKGRCLHCLKVGQTYQS
jgi:L-ascorbate metabolism protein UlaG (beta-lactamase superfamily)